jgi:bacterioferritin-associated ferredoxin
MIVCSCNVLSDHQVRSAVMSGRDRPPTVSQVYACLGCSAKCGRCAPTIKRLRDEAKSAVRARFAELSAPSEAAVAFA